MARLTGVLQLGRISFDGTKIHADASKSNAVSYKRLLEIEQKLQLEVEELFALGERAEQAELPDGLVVDDEIALRTARLARLFAQRDWRGCSHSAIGAAGGSQGGAGGSGRGALRGRTG